MRAVELHTPGDPPAVVDRAEPEPAAGQVLVRVTAAPIVPLDLLCASGTSYFGTPRTPYVPGVQGVGTVDGRTVWFPTTAGMAPGDGSMAELAAVAERDLVTLPDGVVADRGGRARALGDRGAHGADLARRAGPGRDRGRARRRRGGRPGRHPAGQAVRRRARHRRRPLPRGAAAGAGRRRGRRGRPRHRLARGGRRARRPDRRRRRRPRGPGARPAVRRTGRRGGQVPAPRRAAGQPGQLGRRALPAGLLDDPEPVAAGARLHQQRADPRAEGRGHERGRAARRGRRPAGRPRGGAARGRRRGLAAPGRGPDHRAAGAGHRWVSRFGR